MRRERAIENKVLNNPKCLGLGRVDLIRHARVAPRSGTVDIMAFPRRGPVRLALIEAKRSIAADSASKVIGQLLMYYSGALTLGADGLELLSNYARQQTATRTKRSWVSPKQVTGGVTPPSAAWRVLQSGRKLRPRELALFVALDAEPRESLATVLAVLRRHHGLDVRVILATRGSKATLLG